MFFAWVSVVLGEQARQKLSQNARGETFIPLLRFDSILGPGIWHHFRVSFNVFTCFEVFLWVDVCEFIYVFHVLNCVEPSSWRGMAQKKQMEWSQRKWEELELRGNWRKCKAMSRYVRTWREMKGNEINWRNKSSTVLIDDETPISQYRSSIVQSNVAATISEHRSWIL